jgi:hypothetical protein
MRLTTDTSSEAELGFSSIALPGGSLLASIYDRAFMQLSDRGGASNVVGDRWAEICAAALDSASESSGDLRTGESGVVAETTVRLDHIPEIARTASRNQMQNPDFLMVGERAGVPVMWAADAKFSVDTARSKQVSSGVVQGLLGLGGAIRELLPNLDPEMMVEDGVFLCPDYPLTHRLLHDRRGPRRATVRVNEVRFVPVSPEQFLEPLGHQGLQAFFTELDAFPIDPSASLMLAVYYFRLSRAALGCWQDQTSPLLAYRDIPMIDESAVEAEAKALATIRTSAWGLVQRWNDLADTVRQQRAAIDQVTSPPVNGKKLREQIEIAAKSAGVIAPSGSKVRRAIGSWYRGQVREQFGPVYPPVADFGALLDDMGRFCRSLQAETVAVTDRTIEELVAEAPPVAS